MFSLKFSSDRTKFWNFQPQNWRFWPFVQFGFPIIHFDSLTVRVFLKAKKQVKIGKVIILFGIFLGTTRHVAHHPSGARSDPSWPLRRSRGLHSTTASRGSPPAPWSRMVVCNKTNRFEAVFSWTSIVLCVWLPFIALRNPTNHLLRIWANSYKS